MQGDIMYDKILFHGTEIKRGEKMLERKKMFVSSGDKYWLGNGSYFYEDDFYAYKWIKDMYIKKHEGCPALPEDLFKEYKILRSRIRTGMKRVFDLDKPRNKIEFDKTYENCKSKQKHSSRFSNVKMPEGVVLNIMFNDMGYSEEYDVVIATFRRRGNKYSGLPMRLNFISEKQICVKKVEKASPIDFYRCKHKIPEFQNCIDNLYKVSGTEQRGTVNKVFTYDKNVKRKQYRVDN